MKPRTRIPRRSPNYARKHKANLKNKRERQQRKAAKREPVGEVRLKVYERDNHRCQVRKHPKCLGNRELPWDGDIFERFHMAHRHAKRRFGTTVENCVGACYWCHIVVMHTYGKDGNKPVPKKSLASVSDVCIIGRHEEISDVSPGSDVEAARKDAS